MIEELPEDPNIYLKKKKADLNFLFISSNNITDIEGFLSIDPAMHWVVDYNDKNFSEEIKSILKIRR